MGYTVIAPVGDNPKALFIGMKEFPTEKVILITPHANHEKAVNLAKQLEDFTIKSDIKDIGGNILHEMFRVFGEICSIYDSDDIVVNVGTGDRMTTCAAISASYANGLKAFDCDASKCIILPIMKLSYYHELSDNKMKVLEALHPEDYTTMKALGKKLNMSVSLLSYHLNGNYKFKGLKEFRLVELKEQGKHLLIRLSGMGDMLLRGYVKQKSKEKE